MRDKVFLYKDKTEDRDCCAYISTTPSEFICEHYFSTVTLQGACYSGREFAEYKEIKTVLTETEYNKLVQFGEDIAELGFGIKKDDDRYKRGVELCEAIQPVYDRLLSEDNKRLFEEIQEEEGEYLKKEYSFCDEDIQIIFGEYRLDYRDRAVVGCVYRDAEELGEEEALYLGVVDYKMNDIARRYFDFEQFGEDIADDENHCRLSDGRIISLNY